MPWADGAAEGRGRLQARNSQVTRMCRTLSVCSWLGVFFLIASVSHAQDKPALKDALALQEAIQDAIAEAEQSVACIIVSRSERYAEVGQGPTDPSRGILGEYRPPEPRQGRFGAPVPDKDKKLDLADSSNVPESYGSGVAIDAQQGLILTNRHVVLDAAKLYVRLPSGKGSYANIHAADPRSDLAVLKLIRSPADLKAIKLGDGGKVRKGQFIVALANPFAAGFKDGSPSASWGIISNIRRRAPGNPKEEKEEAPPEGSQKKPLHRYGTLLQIDARLNLGCSGGALINLRGEMVGLTTSLAAISGGETAGGYAVPLDAGIRRIVDVLKQGKAVEYGFLGIKFERPISGREGVPVSVVIRGSPAAEGGLQAGDTILGINEEPVRDIDELFRALGMLLADAEARVEVDRIGRGRVTATARLAKFYVPGKIIASNAPEAVHGCRVDYTSILVQTGPEAPIRRGVIVQEVVPGSAAERAEIRVNDVITHVNGKPIATPAEVYKLARQPGSLTLTLEPNRTIKLN